MDLSTDLITGGASAGAGLGAAWVLVRGIGRYLASRGDKNTAEAATETSQAKALGELVCQLADLRARVSTVEKELAEERDLREKLQEEVTEERERRTAAEKLVAVLEGKVSAAEERAAFLERQGNLIREEWRKWREFGQPTTRTDRPPKLRKP